MRRWSGPTGAAWASSQPCSTAISSPESLLPVIPAVAILDFQWEDGWYFALGGEYDYSDALTLRAGVGYEISPIREASQRLVQLPDNDRVWLSGGASYKVGDLFGLLKDATIDLAYTHVFVEDGNFERSPSATGLRVPGHCGRRGSQRRHHLGGSALEVVRVLVVTARAAPS